MVICIPINIITQEVLVNNKSPSILIATIIISGFSVTKLILKYLITRVVCSELILLIIAPIFVEDGAVIRLEHALTEKRLHSHDVRPPMTDVDWQYEVSAYGFPGFEGDANDLFRVEIIKSYSAKGVARERLR